ncbi:MAG: mevalonate kinase [Anaerolineae bacterium]
MNEVVSASAPGKVILFGEHAVVYGRPAIAVPVRQVEARATVEPAQSSPSQAGEQRPTIHASDLDHTFVVDPADTSNPLVVATVNTLRHLGAGFDHDLLIQVGSTIPVGRGLGSSASVSVALARAVARYFNVELTPSEVSRLAYKTEIIHHGTPSGIDNTVIAYDQSIYFVREQPVDHFDVGQPLHLVIADTGITTPTHLTVGDVRAGWQHDPTPYEALFDEIGGIVDAARAAIAEGDLVEAGRLMDENHTRLRQLDVSCDELDRLVYAARGAGAMGAKMSGGGRGGNIVAIAMPWAVEGVVRAMRRAGAVMVIETVVQ